MAIANFDKTVLLLPFNESNGTSVFNDYSSRFKTHISASNAASNAQSKYYTTSAYFIGTTYIEYSSTSDFIFGTSDFMVSAWVYRVGNNAWQTICGQWNNTYDAAWSLHITGTNNLAFLCKAGSTDYYVGTSSTIPQNQWSHVAACRSGSTIRLFIDGVAGATRSDYTSLSIGNSTYGIRLGRSFAVTDYFTGYINDLMILKGAAGYTTGFTPPGKLAKSVSGTIKDDTNSNAIRTVSALPRILNCKNSFSTTSAADGTYSLTVPDVEHSVIVLDDDAGTVYNDLIKRATPV